jgi:hypothetical protein
MIPKKGGFIMSILWSRQHAFNVIANDIICARTGRKMMRAAQTLPGWETMGIRQTVDQKLSHKNLSELEKNPEFIAAMKRRAPGYKPGAGRWRCVPMH